MSPQLKSLEICNIQKKIDASNQNYVSSVDANVTEAEEKIREKRMVRSERKARNLSRIK